MSKLYCQNKSKVSDIYVPMVPGGDESPLHNLCFIGLGRYPTSRCGYVDVCVEGRILKRSVSVLMNATFQELSLVTPENLLLMKVL